jgi:hypothetical protein
MAQVSKAQQVKIDLVERHAMPAASPGEGVTNARTQARRHLERSDVDSMLAALQPDFSVEVEPHAVVEHFDEMRCSIYDEQDLLLNT